MSMITPKTIVITAYPKNGSLTNRQPEISLLDPNFGEDGGPKKRRRLTHLSPDEKLLRRKLKNRVAAQTARDRKKQQMGELEEKVAQLEEENKALRKQNMSLRDASQTLVKENASLRSRLSTADSTLKTESGTFRSAAPAVPLQKEQVQILSRWMEQYMALVLMVSLMISSACFKSIQPLEESASSSRKRKQPHPARRPEAACLNSRGDKWWGAHQQSWNPSMN